MTWTNETMEIRPVRFIRWLAMVLSVVVVGPSALGCLYLAFHWSELVANLPGAALCSFIAVVGSFLSYRWLTIHGRVDDKMISLRGWFTTCRVERDQLSKIRREQYRKTSTVNGDVQSQTVWWYSLYDHEDQMIGRIPDSLLLCRDWDKFLERLYAIASESRRAYDQLNGKTYNKRESLKDMPVDEWTAEDIDRYENGE